MVAHSCTRMWPGEWPGNARDARQHWRKRDDWRRVGPVSRQEPRTGWKGGCESGSWMAHSCIAETCAGRFSGMPVSMRLFSAHEDDDLVVIFRMSLSSAKSRHPAIWNEKTRVEEKREAKRASGAGKAGALCAGLQGQPGSADAEVFACVPGRPDDVILLYT